jgi:hypothetical protein
VSSLLRRIEALERKMSMGEITLTMSDGTTRKVEHRRILPMLGEALGEFPMGADTRSVIDSMSDNGVAVGAGHMCQVIRVMAAAGISADEVIE